jgi:phytoene/squalene synthetase
MLAEPMIRVLSTPAPAYEAAALEQRQKPDRPVPDAVTSPDLAVFITRAASKQAYYTVRVLVDHDRRPAAYQAYAYFRWVDDHIDQPASDRTERLDFITRQQELVTCIRSGQQRSDLTPEERLVVDLMQGDDEPSSRLQSYITHMMAVMAFDASRRGSSVTEWELDGYTRHLAVAVTDVLHYFIGHRDAPSPSESGYAAAMGAHITHMLRDTYEDAALGYFNVPRELMDASGIGPRDLDTPPYCAWVKRRVELARLYFAQGARYLDQLKSLRCRLAGYAYMARFAGVLDAIECDDYHVRPAYPECARRRYTLRVGGAVALRALLGGAR